MLSNNILLYPKRSFPKRDKRNKRKEVAMPSSVIMHIHTYIFLNAMSDDEKGHIYFEELFTYVYICILTELGIATSFFYIFNCACHVLEKIFSDTIIYCC